MNDQPSRTGQQPESPYPGPRTFGPEHARYFYGRDRETRELLAYVLSHRLVLFDAPSGAGKSSLIHTRLVPGLEAQGFEVLPVARVSGHAAASEEIANIFVHNLLLNLHQKKVAGEPFTKMSLKEFLAGLVTDGGEYYYDVFVEDEAPVGPSSAGEPEAIEGGESWPRALIIDQFEELLTTHVTEWEKREDFFSQLREAMDADPQLWVVLVIREDYAARLNRFAALLPGRLRDRYHMDRMRRDSALDAVVRPAEAWTPKRTFEAGLAKTLVENLLQITAQEPGRGPVTTTGEYVEPVQLQVVCLQLWQEAEANDRSRIETADLQRLAARSLQVETARPALGVEPPAQDPASQDLARFVDQALGLFYEAKLCEVIDAHLKGRSEFELREWFAGKLITADQTRSLVPVEGDVVGGLDREVVRELEDRFLLRSVSRTGSSLGYELVHDRFIDPILQSNAAWLAEHPLIQDAKAWQRTGSGLYRGKELARAREDPDAEIPLVQTFLAACEQAEEEERMRASIKKLTRIMVGVAAAAVVVIALAVIFSAQAFRDRKRAGEQIATATVSIATSVARINQASSRERKAQATQNAAEAEAWAAKAEAQAAKDEAQGARAEAQAAATASALAAQQEANSRARLLGYNARYLADEANRARSSGDMDAAVLLGIQAVRTFDTDGDGRPDEPVLVQAHDALLQALLAVPFPGRTLEHAAGVVSVAFAPDGSLLATASVDGIAHVWDVPTGQELQTLSISPGAEGYYRMRGLDVAFDPDGRLVAVGAEDSAAVVFWDVESGTQLRTVPTGHSDVIWSIAVSPDGRYLATGDRGGELRVWDLVADERVWVEEAHEDAISSLDFSPNSRLVATAGMDGAVGIWNVSAQRQVDRLRGHGDWVNQVTFVGDGTQVATASDDGTAMLWTFDSDGEPEYLAEPYDEYIFGIDYSPGQGTPILAMVDAYGEAILLEQDDKTGEWKQAASFSPHLSVVWALALSPDGTHLATVSDDQTARLWEIPDDLDQRAEPVLERGIQALSVSPEGHCLAAAPGEWGEMRVMSFTAETTAAPITVTLGVTITPYAQSGDGSRVATLDGQGTPRVWDLASGRPREVSARSRSERAEQAEVNRAVKLLLNWDGTLVALDAGKEGIDIWDVATGEREAKLEHLSEASSALAFSPDNAHLVRAIAGDPELEVWDIASTEKVDKLTVGEGVDALAFSRDGALLATAHEDGRVQIWQDGTGDKTPILKSPELDSIVFYVNQPVGALAFSPEGSQLVVVLADGAVRFFSLDVNQLLDRACQHTSRNLTWFEWRQHRRAIGEHEPGQDRSAESCICPHLPIHSSFIDHYVRQGERGIETAMALLEPTTARQQIARALLAYAEQEARLRDPHDAWTTLERLRAEYAGGLTATQSVGLAETYAQVCGLFLNSPYPTSRRARSSCEQAVDLVAATESVRLNLQVCQYSTHEDAEDLDIAPACDRLVELGTQIQDASESLDICLHGTLEGLSSEVESICERALALSETSPPSGANLKLCLEGDAGDWDDQLSDICQRIVQNLPYIELDVRKTGYIENPDGEYWVFWGVAGQFVDIALGGYDTIVELWSTDPLERLAYDDDGGDGATSNSLISGFPLPRDDLYVINARGYGGQIGEYFLTLTERPVGELSPGIPVSEDIAELSHWAFSGQRGDIVSLAMDAVDSGFDPDLTLFWLAPAGLTRLAYNDDSDGSLNARIDGILLPETGLYFIQAGRTGGPAEYMLTLTLEEPRPVELGLHPLQAVSPVSSWLLAGEPGQRVRIGVDEPAGSGEVSLTVLDPDGELLAQETGAFLATLPVEGLYTIVARGFEPGRTGYTLSVRELTEAFGSIAYGETKRDAVEAASEGYWTFVGHPGEAAAVAVESDSDGLVLELYDPLGALMAECAIDGGVPIEVSTAIWHSGTHILVLRGRDAGSSVAYSLSLTEAEVLPVVVWTAFVDVDEEYAYVLDVLSNHAGALPYVLIETDTQDPDVMARMLQGQSLLLIPEQEAQGSSPGQIGRRLGPVVDAFVRAGGRVVSLCDRSYYGDILSAMGLLDAFTVSEADGVPLEIIEPSHPLAWNLPGDWQGANATAAYRVENVDATVVVRSGYGDAVVVSRTIGAGEVVLIGFDYYESNAGADQLLVNAVFGLR